MTAGTHHINTGDRAGYAFPLLLKTRLAPTPSGFLHLGNIMSFVLTAALAERHGAQLLLRIDDLDRQRLRADYVQDIFDTLRFLDLPWQEGPRDIITFERYYSQLHRMDLYREALQQLRDEERVFACNCSRTTLAASGGIYNGACLNKKLSLDDPDVCWRLRTDEPRELIARTCTFPIHTKLPAAQRYFIVRKKDGFPAYQLSSLIDDLHFGIDLIVRGEDLWPSTLAQLYLAGSLRRHRFKEVVFYHHLLLTDNDGTKLSKSAGATSLHYLRHQGDTPADICTSIARQVLPGALAENRYELGRLLLDHLPEPQLV